MSMEKTYAYEVEKIFTSWYSSLCYFAFRYVQDDETARDIVQEVFVRLMEKRQTFQSEQHLKNFLYLTIKNDCLNHLRNRLSREHYLSYLKHEGEQDEFECRMIETEIFSRLRKAIEKLPRECRKVFELCYFEGMNNEKAAQTLRISIETVKAQKKRGKQILRKNLQELYPLFALLFGL